MTRLVKLASLRSPHFHSQKVITLFLNTEDCYDSIVAFSVKLSHHATQTTVAAPSFLTMAIFEMRGYAMSLGKDCILAESARYHCRIVQQFVMLQVSLTPFRPLS